MKTKAVGSGISRTYLYLLLKRVKFPLKFLIWYVLCVWFDLPLITYRWVLRWAESLHATENSPARSRDKLSRNILLFMMRQHVVFDSSAQNLSDAAKLGREVTEFPLLSSSFSVHLVGWPVQRVEGFTEFGFSRGLDHWMEFTGPEFWSGKKQAAMFACS